VKTAMIAYCGLNCAECPGYVATQSGDEEALKKVVAQWSDEYSGTLTIDDVRCSGCHATQGPLMSHCSVCGIRVCSAEKSLANCAHCDEFACDKLTKFFGFVPGRRRRSTRSARVCSSRRARIYGDLRLRLIARPSLLTLGSQSA